MQPIDRRVNCRCFAGDPFNFYHEEWDDAAHTTKSDLTGYKLSLIIKSSLALSDAQAEFNSGLVAVQDPTNGAGHVGATSQDTINLLGDYEYAFVLVDNGTPAQETVNIYGTVTFEKKAKASLG